MTSVAAYLGGDALRRLWGIVFVAAAFASLAEARAGDPPADFSGVYLGLTTGYGFGASGDWCVCTFLPSVADATEGEGGITAGGEAGYAVRWGPLVVEAAARASYADIRFSNDCAGTPCSGQAAWLGEVQVSAGFIVFSNILLAGSYGYAAGDVEAKVGTAPPTTALHDGNTFAARIEQGMSDGWRMGLEYRRYDMQGANDTPAGEVDIDWKSEAIALVIHYELPD